MKNKRSNLFIFILALCCGLIEGRKEAFRAFSYGHGKSFDKNQRSKTDSSWENNHTIPFVYGTFLPAALSRSIKPDLQSFDLLDCKGQKTVLEKFGLHRWGAKHRFGIRYFNKTFSLTPYVLTHPGSILEQNSGHGPALLHNATLTPHPILTPNENLVKQIQYTEQPEIRLQDFSNDLNDHESQEIGTDLDRCHDESEKKTPEKTLVAQKMDFESDIDDKDDGAPVASIVLTEHDQPTQPLVHEAKVLIQHNRPTQPAAPGTTKKVINISHTVNESIDPALVWTAAYDPITPTYDPITPTYDPITPTFIPNKREEAGLILSLTAPAATPIADELAAEEAAQLAKQEADEEAAEKAAEQQRLADLAAAEEAEEKRKADELAAKEAAQLAKQEADEEAAEKAAEQQRLADLAAEEAEEKRKADELAAEEARKKQKTDELADEEEARLAEEAADEEEARLAQLEHQRKTDKKTRNKKSKLDRQKQKEAQQRRENKKRKAEDVADEEAARLTKKAAEKAAQLAKQEAVRKPVQVEQEKPAEQRIVERASQEGRNLFLVEKHGAHLDGFQQKDPNFQGQQIYFVTKEDLSNVMILNVFIENFLLNRDPKSNSLVKLLGDENEVNLLQLHKYLEKIINDYNNNNLEKLLFTQDSLPFLKGVFALVQKIGTFYNQSNDESKKNRFQLLDNPIMEQLICQEKSIKKDLSGNTFTAQNKPYLTQYDGNQLAVHQQCVGPIQKPILTQEQPLAQLEQQRIALAQLEKKIADEEAGLILSLTAPAATPIADELAAATPIAPAATPIADELAEQNLAPIAVQQRKTDKKTRKKKAKVGQQRKEEAQQRIAQQKAQLEQQQIVEQKRKADELAAELARKELAAQLEQQRIASAQLEKKLADEEAARLAKKAAEKAAELEQQRIAADEAEEARKKQEEDEKAAAEEARLAQLEQQRKKQEAEQQRIAKEAEAADLAAQLAKEVEEKRKADEAAQLAKEVEEKRKADELAKARIADLAKQEADEEDAEDEAAAGVADEKLQQEQSAQVWMPKLFQGLNRADAKEAEEADAEEADAADEESDEKAQNVPNLSLGNNPFCAAADEEVKVEGKVKNVQKLSIICSDGLASRNNSLIPRAPEQSDKHKKRLQSTLAELLQMSYNVQVQNQNPPDNVQLQRQVGPKGKNRNAPAGNQVLAKTNTKPNKQQADELAKQKAELEEQQRQEEARKKQLAAQLKAQQQVMAEERIVQNKAAEKAQLTNAEKARLADLAEAEQQRLAEVRKTQEKLKADKEAQKKLAVQVAQQQKADLEEKQRIAKEAAAAVKLAQAQTRRVKQKAGEKRKADKLKAEELEVALKNQEKRKANKEVWNKQKADEAAVQLEKNLAELAEEQQRIAAKVWNKKKADELAKERIAALAAAEEAQLEEVQLEEVQKKGIADDQLKAQLAAAQQKLLIQEPGSNQIESRILEESKDNIITQELECVALKNCDHNHDHEITQEQEKFIELTNCFELRDGKIFQLVLNAQYDPKTRTGKTESSYTKFINGERTNRVGEIKGLFGWKQDRTLGRVQDTFAVKILDINGFTISPTTSDKAQEVVFIGKKCTLYKTEDKYFIKNNEEGAKFKHYNITPPKKEVMFSPQVMFSQQNIKGESKYRGCCTTGNGSRPDAKRQNFVQKNFVLKREGGGICLTEWEYDAQALKNDLKNDPTNWGEIGDRTGTFKMNASLPPDNGELPYSEMPHYKRGGVVASLHPDDGRGQTSPVQRVFGLEIQNVSASATGSENSSGKKSSATGNDHSSAEKIQKKIGNTQNIQTVKNAEKFVNKITDEVKLRKSILRNVR